MVRPVGHWKNAEGQTMYGDTPEPAAAVGEHDGVWWVTPFAIINAVVWGVALNHYWLGMPWPWNWF